MEVYNVQPAEVDLFLKRNDTINLSFDITQNDVSYDLSTAKEVTFTIKAFDKTVKTQLKSTGTSPGLTVTSNNLVIRIPAGVNYHGSFKYDLQVKDADDNIFTIMEGMVIISKDIS